MTCLYQGFNCSVSEPNQAPVALFVFNRPQPTAKVYERIRAAQPKRLLVIADGPRASRPDDAALCEATRQIVSAPDWPCELLTSFSDVNLGCRNRMSSGLDWVFLHCSEAIILEDDCVPDPSFFGFCSSMLSRYRDDQRIVHVSGDNYQGGRHRGDASYFFSRYSLTWGWATWRRAWRHYDVNISYWPALQKERWLESFLDIPEEVRYWETIFDRLYRGEIDTWDYQWLLACWREGGLSIHPNENLVTNIGAGPDATHLKDGHSTIGVPTKTMEALVHPAQVIRNQEADRFMFEMHIGRQQMQLSGSWLANLKRRMALRTRMKRLAQRIASSGPLHFM